MSYAGRWWHMLDDGRMQCDLCQRDCRLHEGQRGACFVRQRGDGELRDQMLLATYGRSSGFCIDPVEKNLSIIFILAPAFCRSAPLAATLPASSARTGTSASRAKWTR